MFQEADVDWFALREVAGRSFEGNNAIVVMIWLLWNVMLE
jgi:hypothetical protein